MSWRPKDASESWNWQHFAMQKEYNDCNVFLKMWVMTSSQTKQFEYQQLKSGFCDWNFLLAEIMINGQYLIYDSRNVSSLFLNVLDKSLIMWVQRKCLTSHKDTEVREFIAISSQGAEGYFCKAFSLSYCKLVRKYCHVYCATWIAPNVKASIACKRIWILISFHSYRHWKQVTKSMRVERRLNWVS